MINKKGDMTLYGTIISLVLIVLLCPVLIYMQRYEQVSEINGGIRNSFSDMCVSSSIVHYDEIKYSIDKSEYDSGIYLSSIMETNGFIKSGNKWSKDSVTIQNAKLDFDNKNYEFVLNYDISIPFKFFNKEADNSVFIHKSFRSGLVSR